MRVTTNVISPAHVRQSRTAARRRNRPPSLTGRKRGGSVQPRYCFVNSGMVSKCRTSGLAGGALIVTSTTSSRNVRGIRGSWRRYASIDRRKTRFFRRSTAKYPGTRDPADRAFTSTNTKTSPSRQTKSSSSRRSRGFRQFRATRVNPRSRRNHSAASLSPLAPASSEPNERTNLRILSYMLEGNSRSAGKHFPSRERIQIAPGPGPE